MVEKLIIDLPKELVDEVDRFVELIGFECREEFVKAAVRRCIDHYTLCADRALN